MDKKANHMKWTCNDTCSKCQQPIYVGGDSWYHTYGDDAIACGEAIPVWDTPEAYAERFLELSLEMHKFTRGYDFGQALANWPSAKLHEWFNLGNKLNK